MSQENELFELQRHNAIQDARISNLDTKFEMFMQEMRDRDNQRREEIKDIKTEMRRVEKEKRRNEMEEFKKSLDVHVEKIKSDCDSICKYLQLLNYTFIFGIVVIFLAGLFIRFQK